MVLIRQENGKTVGYASIAPPSAEAELWIEVAEDDPRVTEYLNPPVPEITLEQAIAQTQRAMQSYAQLLLEQAVRGYSNEERDTWTVKDAEAIAFLASGNSDDAPYLSIEASAAGISLEAIATIVSNKAAMLKTYTSHVLGNRSHHYREIGLSITVEDAQTYDYLTGWSPS